ncbi:MAG: spore coat protein CotJB [Clostridiales bacterium]|nr:spore coat protein CotJB [Clostridiales bacterium]
MDKKEMLKKIRKYQFFAIDLNLYLDNFPEEKQAKEDYKLLSSKLDCLIKEYEKNYGPLSNFGNAYFECPESWTDSPWPWEKQ